MESPVRPLRSLRSRGRSKVSLRCAGQAAEPGQCEVFIEAWSRTLAAMARVEVTLARQPRRILARVRFRGFAVQCARL